MGLFDRFKKKAAPPAASKLTAYIPGKAATPAANGQSGDILDDVTFIRDMRHTEAGGWHQYDVLLAARGYGWEMMLDWADYLAGADLDHISQVISSRIGAQEMDCTASYSSHNGRCRETPELQMENGVLSIAGISRTLATPMKIVWFNQTQVLRFFTLVDDELTIRKYVETVIRRTFGTDKAMKLAKDIPASR